MKFLFISKNINLNKYSRILDILKEYGCNYSYQNSMELSSYEAFDFLVIDWECINLKTYKHHTPYIILINSETEIDTEFNDERCMGLVDLDSNLFALKSVFSLIIKSIICYNDGNCRKIVDFLKTLPTGVIIYDKKGKITELNSIAKEILSIDISEMNSESGVISDFQTIQEDGSKIEQQDFPVMQVVRNKRSSLNRIIGISHGRLFFKWIKIDAVPFFDSNNEIQFIYSIIEDITQSRNTHLKLEMAIDNMDALVRQRTTALVSARALTLESLATLSEFRDNETGDHIRRTKFYFKLIVDKLRKRLKYSDEEIVQMWSSAPLHDIGKVAIPDNILLKNDSLTDEEYEIMKQHTIHGNKALVRISECKDDDSYLNFAKEITLFHHEKWDGSGYPYGISGDEIPISARIMALADVYDALRSDRPYKKGYDHEKVCRMIIEESGKHFEPILVEIFNSNNEEFDYIYNRSIEEKNLFGDF